MGSYDPVKLKCVFKIIRNGKEQDIVLNFMEGKIDGMRFFKLLTADWACELAFTVLENLRE